MIDPNEAPEGFVAAPSKHACAGCHFYDRYGDCTLMDFTCYPSQRKDGENVIFIPREQSSLAENGDELQKAKDEAARWKAACLERDELIAKLKAQLTTALESIARMR